MDLHIDVKHFPVYLNGRARAHAAREGTRGAYRTPGQGLEAPYLKHDRKYKYNPGARGAMVLAGVVGGNVLLWEVIDGRNWNGDVASEMYGGGRSKRRCCAHVLQSASGESWRTTTLPASSAERESPPKLLHALSLSTSHGAALPSTFVITLFGRR